MAALRLLLFFSLAKYGFSIHARSSTVRMLKEMSEDAALQRDELISAASHSGAQVGLDPAQGGQISFEEQPSSTPNRAEFIVNLSILVPAILGCIYAAKQWLEI